MKPHLLNIRSGNAHGTSNDRSSDSLGRGMDIALTLLVFVGLGALVDRWLGIFPVVTIALVLFAAIGTFIRLKCTYDTQMEALEAELRGRLHPETTNSPQRGAAGEQVA